MPEKKSVFTLIVAQKKPLAKGQAAFLPILVACDVDPEVCSGKLNVAIANSL